MEGALTGYAVRVLVHLTHLPQRARIKAVEIGRATRVPYRELDRVLRILVGAGYVDRSAAVPPDYSLECCPWSITLLNLYELTGESPFGSRSATNETWGELGFEVEGGLLAYLKEESIGALAGAQGAVGTRQAPEIWVG
jgi:DNA-binding IscR family transcriptional regulator